MRTLFVHTDTQGIKAGTGAKHAPPPQRGGLDRQLQTAAEPGGCAFSRRRGCGYSAHPPDSRMAPAAVMAFPGCRVMGLLRGPRHSPAGKAAEGQNPMHRPAQLSNMSRVKSPIPRVVKTQHSQFTRRSSGELTVNSRVHRTFEF